MKTSLTLASPSSALQFTQNNLEAKKGLVAFPTAAQRSDSDNAYTFEEGDVYGLNIIVTDGERSVSWPIFAGPRIAVVLAVPCRDRLHFLSVVELAD